MADTQDLLLTATKALKLDDDLKLLKAIGDTVANWGQLVTHLNGVASVEALLNKLAGDLNSAEITQAFQALGLDDTRATLVAFLAKITGVTGSIPAKYKALLNPLGSFAVGDSKAVVGWTVATSNNPVVKTDRYALNIGAEAALTFDAGSKWPEDAAAKKLLKLEAGGKVTAGATATLPYAFGTVTGGIGGSADLKLGYYFDAPDTEIYAAAIVRRLGDLVDPFDYPSVWSALTGPSDLQGMVYAYGGAANANIQVGFADAQAIGAGIVNVAMTVSVSASLTSRYALTLQRAAGGQISAKLSRSKVDQSTFSDELKLEVDVSALTKPVAAALKQAVDTWDAVLADIKPYLSPGTWLRDQALGQLTTQLKTLISDANLRDAVLTDLKGGLGIGTVDDLKIAGWLSDKVTGALDHGSVLITGLTTKPIDRAMASLTAALPTLAEADVGGQLKTLVAGQIDKVEQALKDAVQKVLDGPAAAGLATALRNAGATVNGEVKKLDDALKAVRDLLDRYNTVFHNILDKAQEAAKAKVTARLYSAETRTDKVTVEVAGAFTALAGPEKVFQALTRGTLRSLEMIVDGQETAPGFTLDQTSSITRFSKIAGEDGLEISFLNVVLKAQALTSVEATVVVDGAGDVQVNTAGELKKTVMTPLSTRSVSFADSHRLLLARKMAEAPAQGRANLDMTIAAAYSDKTLKWGDVADFVSGLKAANLLPSTAVDSARKQFDTWSQAAGGGGKISADLSATLRLDIAAAETLMRINDRTATDLNQPARKLIVTTAVDALVSLTAINKASFANGMASAAGQFLSPPAPITVSDTVLGYHTPHVGIGILNLPPKDTPPTVSNTPVVFMSSQGQRDYVYFLAQAYALERLVELIDTMGDIYQSTPSSGSGPGWTVEHYLSAQADMVRDSGYWLTVFQDLGSLFQANIARRTLAFMRTLATLSGRDPTVPGGVMLTMTYHPTTGEAETVRFQ